MKMLAWSRVGLIGGWMCLVAHAGLAQGYGQTQDKPRFAEGRVYLNDGSVQTGRIALVGHNQIKLKPTVPAGEKSAEKPAEKIYSALEIRGFVVKGDSFTVVKDFTVFRDDNDQHYNSGFMRVCAAGAGTQLYEFTFMSEHEVQTFRSAGASPATGAPLGYLVEEQVFMMTKYLLLHRGDKWLALPSSGRRLREIIEPAIADDAALRESVHWGTLQRGSVAALMQHYINDKSGPAKP